MKIIKEEKNIFVDIYREKLSTQDFVYFCFDIHFVIVCTVIEAIYFNLSSKILKLNTNCEEKKTLPRHTFFHSSLRYKYYIGRHIAFCQPAAQRMNSTRNDHKICNLFKSSESAW